MKGYNKSEIMKRAWSFKKTSKMTLSEALKRAWAEAKKALLNTTRYIIEDWFMNKNYDKVSTMHCECYQRFGKADIIKETEKALLVKLGMCTKAGYETDYTKNVWVPKSVVSEFYF